MPKPFLRENVNIHKNIGAVNSHIAFCISLHFALTPFSSKIYSEKVSHYTIFGTF